MSQDSEETLDFTIGDVLAGKYRVDRVLGAGGMGVVVQATHVMLEDRVARKFLHREILENDTITQRFLREAQAAARIKNPHVARVIDVGTLETGSPFMVMEYLDGQDLAAEIEEKGQLPLQLAVAYTLQACEALMAAHRQHIVHRDIKPANLFVSKAADGRPAIKVLDFGISKVSNADNALTRTQTTMGSPLYMAPEQMRSAKDVDQRADVWSLGVVFYEMLTSEVPFNAESLPQLIQLVLGAEYTPVTNVRADVPAEVAQAIDRCLQQDREARFPSVAELAAAISPFADDLGRVSAERVARMADPLRDTGEELVPASRRLTNPGTYASSVTSTGRTTGAAAAAANHWPLIIGGVVAVLAVGGAVTYAMTRPPARTFSDPEGPSSAAIAPSATPSGATASDASSQPPTEDPTVTPELSAAPTPSASAPGPQPEPAPAPTPKPAHHWRRPAPRPKPKPDVDPFAGRD